jgi:hypothetical protein
LNLLLKDIFTIINDNISNKPYVKKYIDKITNSWFGNLLNKFIILMYDILLIPTLTTKLTKITTHGILEVKILDLLTDEEQCKKILLFVNHKISNLINSGVRLEFLSEKKPDFNPETAFGITKHIDSYCHYVIDDYSIPRRTREPYPLPKLNINSGNENWHLLDIDDIINSLDNELTFKLENYQSHPKISAPLSN